MQNNTYKRFIDNKKGVKAHYTSNNKILCNFFSKLLKNQQDLSPEMNEVISKHFWELF
jgi:hypothetical protein